MYFVVFAWFILTAFLLASDRHVEALAASASARKKKYRVKSKAKPSPLVSALQKCTEPAQVLQDVASQLSPSTDGLIASTALVRLSKQLMTFQNEYVYPADSNEMLRELPWVNHVERKIMEAKESEARIEKLVETLANQQSQRLWIR